MTILDIILIVAFIAAAAWGFYKGIINQVGAIAAIVLAIVACRAFGGPAMSMIGTDPEASAMTTFGKTVLVYAVIYFVVYYAVILVARLLKLVTHTVLLGPIDRIAGAVFNIAKVSVVASLLLNVFLWVFSSYTPEQLSTAAGGKLIEFVLSIAPKLLGAITAQ